MHLSALRRTPHERSPRGSSRRPGEPADRRSGGERRGGARRPAADRLRRRGARRPNRARPRRLGGRSGGPPGARSGHRSPRMRAAGPLGPAASPARASTEHGAGARAAGSPRPAPRRSGDRASPGTPDATGAHRRRGERARWRRKAPRCAPKPGRRHPGRRWTARWIARRTGAAPGRARRDPRSDRRHRAAAGTGRSGAGDARSTPRGGTDLRRALARAPLRPRAPPLAERRRPPRADDRRPRGDRRGAHVLRQRARSPRPLRRDARPAGGARAPAADTRSAGGPREAERGCGWQAARPALQLQPSARRIRQPSVELRLGAARRRTGRPGRDALPPRAGLRPGRQGGAAGAAAPLRHRRGARRRSGRERRPAAGRERPAGALRGGQRPARCRRCRRSAGAPRPRGSGFRRHPLRRIGLVQPRHGGLQARTLGRGRPRLRRSDRGQRRAHREPLETRDCALSPRPVARRGGGAPAHPRAARPTSTTPITTSRAATNSSATRPPRRARARCSTSRADFLLRRT